MNRLTSSGRRRFNGRRDYTILGVRVKHFYKLPCPAISKAPSGACSLPPSHPGGAGHQSRTFPAGLARPPA